MESDDERRYELREREGREAVCSSIDRKFEISIDRSIEIIL